MSAFTFSSMGDELDPFMSDNEDPLSPEDQAILSGIYTDTRTHYEYTMNTVPIPQHFAQHPSYAPPPSSNEEYMSSMMSLPMDISPSGAPSNHLPPLMPSQTTMYEYPLHPHHCQPSPPAGPIRSPTYSSIEQEDTHHSISLLNMPVKSLTEEEKKIRRRAQVAKSARKHRNRQKEELTQLRAQVQYLQEQMMLMRGSLNNTIENTDAIYNHRKRKIVDGASDHMMDTVQQSQPTVLVAHSKQRNNIDTMDHWFHHLPIDPIERSKMIQQIATARAQYTHQYLSSTFHEPKTNPFFDIKLFSDGPDMEIKVTRAVTIPRFTHNEVADAAWNTVYNFNLQVPEKYRSYVTCERLMEVDENTRYGRTITPILKNRVDKTVVYVHTYLVVHRTITENAVYFTWETVSKDDLYPFESTDTALWSDEVGCTALETITNSKGEVETLCRSMIHSTPPVNAIAQPRGRLNEAFLTVFCKSASVLDATAIHRLETQYPDRKLKKEPLMN